MLEQAFYYLRRIKSKDRNRFISAEDESVRLSEIRPGIKYV
jgi:hypothetical protein